MNEIVDDTMQEVIPRIGEEEILRARQRALGFAGQTAKGMTDAPRATRRHDAP